MKKNSILGIFFYRKSQKTAAALRQCFSVLLALAALNAGAFYCAAAGAEPLHSSAAAAPVKSAPEIVVSLMPLHSLVSAVMKGVAEPVLIVQGSGSEHGYQLRPQDVKALNHADIVFWAGQQMEVFLQKPLQNLPAQTRSIALETTPDITILPVRSGAGFLPHRHEEDAEAEPPHHEHHDHADNHDGIIGASQENAGNRDLHFWLDPRNAKAMVRYIAAILAEQDPEHADSYRKNAAAYQTKLDNLQQQVQETLAPVRGRPFIVFHDSYQYFERRFSMPALGSVTVNPGQSPSAKRIAAIRAQIQKLSAESFDKKVKGADIFGTVGKENGKENGAASVCVFSEPQFTPRLVRTLIEGTNAKTGVLDPLGSDLPQGEEQYLLLIQNLADSLKRCLSVE